MAKIITYHPNELPGRKLGFRKARKRKNEILEDQGQLNLFDKKDNKYKEPAAKLRKLSDHISPFEEALILDEKGDPRAEERYLDALDQKPYTADSLCNLGVIYAARGETSKSIGAFTKALSIDPRHLESHFNLANIYFDAGNFDLSIVHYEVALEIDPGFGDAWFNLSLAYTSLKNYKKAFDAFLKYKKLYPTEETGPLGDILDSLAKF